MKVPLTTIKYELKAGTKTAYTEVSRKVKSIDEEYYNNLVDSAPFFRRLGGSETLQRCYTQYGYRVFKIISKSPCRQMKTVREIDFN